MTETTGLPEEPTPRPMWRTVRSVAGYALAITFLLFIFPPGFVFVPTLIFVCTLRNGQAGAWSSFALSLLLVSPYLYLLLTNPAGLQIQNPADARLEAALATALLLAICVPALLIVPFMRRGDSFGSLLVLALGFAAAGLGLSEAGFRLLNGFSPYSDQLSRANGTAAQLGQVYQKLGVPIDVAAIQHAMSFATLVLPASFLIEISVVFIISILLFARLKSWREYATRQTAGGPPVSLYRFRNFSLPDWVLFLFIAGAAAPFVSGDLQVVCANLLALVIFLYLMQGLAVLRSLSLRVARTAPAILLGWAGLLMLTVAGIAPFALGIAGLFDPFFDFRNYKRKDDSHESHTD